MPFLSTFFFLDLHTYLEIPAGRPHFSLLLCLKLQYFRKDKCECKNEVQSVVISSVF